MPEKFFLNKALIHVVKTITFFWCKILVKANLVYLLFIKLFIFHLVGLLKQDHVKEDIYCRVAFYRLPWCISPTLLP